MNSDIGPLRLSLDNIGTKPLSFECRTGEVRGILVDGGSKRALIRMLEGNHTINQKEIKINGDVQNFDGLGEAREAGIAIVGQRLSLIPTLTVIENLALADQQNSYFKNPIEWKEQVRWFAEQLHVGYDRIRMPVSELSRDDQQRIEILRLMLGGSRILVLDEPLFLEGSSKPNASRLPDLKQFAQVANVGLIIVTSNDGNAFRKMADKVAVLDVE